MIQYVTINTTGNAADFGNMPDQRIFAVGFSNLTGERGIVGTSSNSNNLDSPIYQIDYMTINSPGNAADFGDLTSLRVRASGFSNG